MSAKIFFITGGSGVGKTTLLRGLEETYKGRDDWTFFSLDSRGVPSKEEMIREYGSVEGWQKAKTYESIDKALESGAKVAIIEGQANPKFIVEGFKRRGFADYNIVLIDCDIWIVAERLAGERGQPQLVTEDLIRWLKSLREQAHLNGIQVIDSSSLSKEQLVRSFQEVLKSHGAL